MRALVIVFFVGVVVGLGLGRWTRHEKPAPVTAAAAECEPAVPVAESKKPEVPPLEKKKGMALLNVRKGSQYARLGLQPALTAPLPGPEAAPHAINLNISEEQVSNLEENFADLQKDVSVYRDQQGWVVRFHHNSNPLADMGLQDNDMIRFSQFHEDTQDPDRDRLYSRLEQVLIDLER